MSIRPIIILELTIGPAALGLDATYTLALMQQLAVVIWCVISLQVKEIVIDNVQKVQMRGERIDEMDERAGNLSLSVKDLVS